MSSLWRSDKHIASTTGTTYHQAGGYCMYADKEGSSHGRNIVNALSCGLLLAKAYGQCRRVIEKKMSGRVVIIEAKSLQCSLAR